jgi:membrane dipeptidase
MNRDWMPEARTITRETVLIDAHLDVPYKLSTQWEDISARVELGDFDYPRALEGGLNAPFFAIYIPADLQQPGSAFDLANSLIDLVERTVEQSPERFVLVRTPAQVVAGSSEDRLAITLAIENGAAIEEDLHNLRHLYSRGIRYVTLCHARDNLICDSSYENTRTWGGLSEFGAEVVHEMNRIGMMVDVSHVSDAALEDVLEITTSPVLVSHSSARHFTPGWERNISDELILGVASTGGVIHVNFGSMFLTQECNRVYTGAMKDVQSLLRERGLRSDEPAGRAVYRAYRSQHEFPYAEVSDVADHIDHIVRIAGIDHVGIGSDFDGVGDSLPEGLKDVSGYPNLVAELLDRGYTRAEIEKILSGNMIRLWTEVQRRAGGM